MIYGEAMIYRGKGVATMCKGPDDHLSDWSEHVVPDDVEWDCELRTDTRGLVIGVGNYIHCTDDQIFLVLDSYGKLGLKKAKDINEDDRLCYRAGEGKEREYDKDHTMGKDDALGKEMTNLTDRDRNLLAEMRKLDRRTLAYWHGILSVGGATPENIAMLVDTDHSVPVTAEVDEGDKNAVLKYINACCDGSYRAPDWICKGDMYTLKSYIDGVVASPNTVVYPDGKVLLPMIEGEVAVSLASLLRSVNIFGEYEVMGPDQMNLTFDMDGLDLLRFTYLDRYLPAPYRNPYYLHTGIRNQLRSLINSMDLSTHWCGNELKLLSENMKEGTGLLHTVVMSHMEQVDGFEDSHAYDVMVMDVYLATVEVIHVPDDEDGPTLMYGPKKTINGVPMLCNGILIVG